MTFTYDLSSPDDVTRVRYHLGDTVENGALFSDEEIQFVIDENGGAYKPAVLSLIRNILAKMSREPDFTADWLKVDAKDARKHWRQLLADKAAELGVSGGSRSGTSVATYRSDSGQTEAPDW